MNKPKKIQIDYNLFQSIAGYIDRHPHYDDPEYRYISYGIDEKMRAITQRNLYTYYKSGESEDMRAVARDMYLDNLGVPDSFRWNRDHDVNVTHHPDDEKY